MMTRRNTVLLMILGMLGSGAFGFWLHVGIDLATKEACYQNGVRSGRVEGLMSSEFLREFKCQSEEKMSNRRAVSHE